MRKFADPAQNRKRLFIAICVGTFSQTLGANLISTYLPVVLQGIGYTSARTKLLINGLETLWATGFCAIGGLISPYVKRYAMRPEPASCFTDTNCRRSHFLWGTTGMLAAFLGWTVASQQYSKTVSPEQCDVAAALTETGCQGSRTDRSWSGVCSHSVQLNFLDCDNHRKLPPHEVVKQAN